MCYINWDMCVPARQSQYQLGDLPPMSNMVDIQWHLWLAGKRFVGRRLGSIIFFIHHGAGKFGTITDFSPLSFVHIMQSRENYQNILISDTYVVPLYIWLSPSFSSSTATTLHITYTPHLLSAPEHHYSCLPSNTYTFYTASCNSGYLSMDVRRGRQMWPMQGHVYQT